MLASSILTSTRLRLLKLAVLMMMTAGVLLSFSRGAWINIVLGLLTLFMLTLVTTRDMTMRARLLLAALAAVALLGFALAVMLTNDDFAALLADRFVLQKDYDSGPSGRFGNQLRSIPDLLGRPFGHGPNRFALYYPENPHNTYLMAFSTYGWLGGITFLCFIGSMIWVSARTAFTRSPFQPYAIMAFSMLLPHLVQNLQIDTDRWRHLFMIYGLNWGIAVITARYMREYRGYAHAAYRATAERAAPRPQPLPPGTSASPA
jgi:O-antigen ligase